MRILFAALALAICLAQTGYAERPESTATPKMQTLSNDEFGRYLKALDSLMGIRMRAEEELRADPTKRADAATQAGLVTQSRSAMESNGFTAESFQSVHWNVMQAFAQVEIQSNADDVLETIRQQREDLAQAKEQISEAEHQQLLARIDNTQALLEGRGGVPEQNVVLIRSNLAALKATFNRGMSGAQSGYRADSKSGH